MTRPAQSSAFSRYAWSFCAYLLLVILFGAWVRVTHSGAGCGSHWPTCHGQIVPLDPSVETVIEYTHRLTSGLLGILGLVLVGWAGIRFRGHRVTAAAGVTLVLIVFEALIGAGLVLRELVADDDSVARAIVIALHLVNTLVLTGAAALTAWWSLDDRPTAFRSLGRAGLLGALGLAALVLTCTSGAVTALGDTHITQDLATGLLERVQDELSPANHFLVRLRIMHPVIAVVTAAGLLWLAGAVVEGGIDPRTRRLGRALRLLVMAQVGIGVVSIGLAAPGWMQLVHLLVAQLVWLTAVLTFVSVAADARLSAASGQPTAAPRG